jgi:hypothetical protein
MRKDNFSKKFKFYRTRNKNSHKHLYFKTQPCLVDFGPKSNGGNANYTVFQTRDKKNALSKQTFLLRIFCPKKTQENGKQNCTSRLLIYVFFERYKLKKL